MPLKTAYSLRTPYVIALTVVLLYQEIFDNYGISGNASTILAEFISADNGRLLTFPKLTKLYAFDILCRNCL